MVEFHGIKRAAAALGLVCGMALGAGPALADDLKPALGEDGIYHYDWYHQSFLELGDDLQDALDEGKILMVKFDQKGCIYCERVALEVLSDPVINAYVRENFVVVQLDIFGARDVTDLDGDTRPENEMARKWGVVFTPTIYFVSEDVPGKTLVQASSPPMTGAFGKLTFYGFLQWVKEKGYENRDVPFQKYYGDRFEDIKRLIHGDKAAS